MAHIIDFRAEVMFTKVTAYAKKTGRFAYCLLLKFKTGQIPRFFGLGL
jgi:hypothetical protein